MLWLPTASVLTLSVATPDPLRTPVPSEVAPSKKATFPVGVPEVAVVVALKTILAPTDAGFGAAETTVVVTPNVGALMVTVTTADVLAENPVLPP